VNGLEGKVALVTGASRGIGRAIGLALARAGATVAGTATSQSGAQAFADQLAADGLGGGGLVMNVNDAAQVDTALAAIRERHGEIAILVNNAGITRDNLLMRMKDDEWDDIMATNLKSVYRLSKAVLRGMMKARYGRIITITSVIGATGNAGQTNYAAAKAGAVGFSKALAREVGSRNITVNCIAPGFIETDMTRALTDDQRKNLLAQIPLARLGDVDDVAHAAVFLASAGASYITGCTLHVNGGMHMD
jgi:3-oxoacyl-[acyl-carrier protein] reductase